MFRYSLAGTTIGLRRIQIRQQRSGVRVGLFRGDMTTAREKQTDLQERDDDDSRRLHAGGYPLQMLESRKLH